MGLKVLVVDDNAVNLKLECDILELEGFAVERAAHAEEARTIIARTQFDIILMDIELPGMDGLSFTRLLKSDPTTAHIPVVAITAFAMKGDDAKAFAAGCAGYITKPIDTRTFPRQVEQFARGAS